MNTTAMQIWENERRLRMIVQSAVYATIENHRELDGDFQKVIHDIALEAALLAVTRVVEGDTELKAARMERDHYRKLAEEALRLSPPRTILIKENPSEDVVEAVARKIYDALDLRLAHLTGRQIIDDGTIIPAIARAALSALPTIADARESALEEAARVAETLVYNPPTDGEMEAWNEAADHIAAAIRKLKDRG